jgi:hypothetical protein
MRGPPRDGHTRGGVDVIEHRSAARGISTHAANLKALMAELMAKSTGSSKGRGGSMHLADRSVGIIGGSCRSSTFAKRTAMRSRRPSRRATHSPACKTRGGLLDARNLRRRPGCKCRVSGSDRGTEREARVATLARMTRSVDHRAIDGAAAARFISAVKRHVEEPQTLQLE